MIDFNKVMQDQSNKKLTDQAVEMGLISDYNLLPDHAVRLHHPYSISKTNHLEDCSGFTSRDGKCEAAEEGERLHEVMDQIAAKLIVMKDSGLELSALAVLADLTGLEDEEYWLLKECCKVIEPYLQRPDLTEIRREEKVHIHNPDGTELTHGHYDLLLIFDGSALCFDWKFGWLPVPPANKNKQGMGYALGNFMLLPHINKIGMMFVQPRLNWVTRHLWERREAWSMYKTLSSIIGNAEFVTKNLNLDLSLDVETKENIQARNMLKVGDYCRYCAIASKCPKLAGMFVQTSYKVQNLPIPPSFDPERIRTPEEAALVRHFADVMEGAIDPIKKRALEIAKMNGDRISVTLPNGEKVVYVVQRKGLDRSLGSPIEIAQVLSEYVSEAEILGAATLALGKLEDIVVNAMIELNKLNGGDKLTKKRAKEVLTSTLEAHGLLTRPDGQIEFLKSQKQKETTEIENKK